MDDRKTSPADQLKQNKALLEQVVRSPDAQRLAELLEQTAGGGLKQAAASAARGDTGALLDMVRRVMGSPEGAKLVERLNRTAPKQ